MGKSEAGKGDDRRPRSQHVSREEVENEWERWRRKRREARKNQNNKNNNEEE